MRMEEVSAGFSNDMWIQTLKNIVSEFEEPFVQL